MQRNANVGIVKILGIPVGDLNMTSAVNAIAERIDLDEGGYVCAIDVYNLVLTRSDEAHRRSLERATMITPDGTPLSWVGRLKGHSNMRRVCGPDLMLEVCRQSIEKGWSHYFYGGAEGVADSLAKSLATKFPGLRVAGVECPPFRPLTDAEHGSMIARLKASKANIIWVGLGCPKQEAWMRDNAELLTPSILIGVGAAFDFHTGRVQRAPVWMREHGMEWLHRLISEPRRLWRRYLIAAPTFAFLCAQEATGSWIFRTRQDKT